MSLRPYPEGIDCIWLATDREWNLGAFITAGMGPIPLAALDSNYIPIEDIEEQLCQLPPVAQAKLLVSVKRPDDFVDLAERGLFVYDWTDISRATHEARRMYEPVAIPSKPITKNYLPSNLETLASALRLADIVFSANDAINVNSHLVCAEASELP
jgi:hypothetical protein